MTSLNSTSIKRRSSSISLRSPAHLLTSGSSLTRSGLQTHKSLRFVQVTSSNTHRVLALRRGPLVGMAQAPDAPGCELLQKIGIKDNQKTVITTGLTTQGCYT